MESHEANAAFLKDTLKSSLKEVAAGKGAVEEEGVWLDAVVYRLIELKSRRDETNASTATCCKWLLQVQMNIFNGSQDGEG